MDCLKRNIAFILWIFSISIFSSYSQSSSHLKFTENKGQVTDQYYKPRPDVLFVGGTCSLNYHLRNNGISYQINRIHESEVSLNELAPVTSVKKEIDKVDIYRLDVNWLNCNHSQIKTSGEESYYENFYLQSCPNGITGVKNYSNITYLNLYPGIDLKWYEKNGSLKYDYFVSAGADYTKIKLEIKGAESIDVLKNGDLKIKTPFGNIIEEAPVVEQDGKLLKAKWLVEKNILSFKISGINKAKPFIIDPLIRLWSTYYGSNLNENGNFVATDASNNVYISGDTRSATNIATVGSYQSTYGGPGSGQYPGDAFLVKFNSSGVRQWATYYGGSGSEYSGMCALNASGDIFLTGGTTSTLSSVISTPGAHQTIFAGGTNYGDCFLVKFNSSGVRQWGTYYGGSAEDGGYGVAVDINGNVCISGVTNSNNNISTIGCHQPTFGGGGSDAFLAKFDQNGTRLWGTYYGGTGGLENGQACEFDNNGDVYLMGLTNSTGGISTPGSHQPVYGGGQCDAMVAKFDNLGIRQWGTYYGGSLRDAFYGIKTNGNNLFLTGETFSTNGLTIATPATHQPANGGGCDAFAVKMSLSGARIWGTYYGGTGNESGIGISIDGANNIYLSGMTTAATGTAIATPCTYQFLYGGPPSDIFLAKLQQNSLRLWGTYYGDFSYEYGGSCATDNTGAVYIAGRTSAVTGTVIASSNGHQPVFGGGQSDAFLAKFDGCVPQAPPNTTQVQDLIICSGNTTALTTTAACSLSWYSTATTTNALATGSILTTGSLTSNPSFYLADLSCGISTLRTLVEVTVVTLPTLSVSPLSPTICAGNSVALTAQGANTYTWQPADGLPISNSTTVLTSPLSNVVYSLSGSNGNCSSNTTVSVNVVPLPVLSFTGNGSYICVGQVIPLSVSGAQNYTWTPASSLTSPTGSLVYASPNSPTSYTVIGSVNSGSVVCTNTSTINLNVLTYPQISVSNSVEICEGENAYIFVTGGNTYSWTPNLNVSNSFSNVVNVHPSSTTLYSVEVTNDGYCPVTGTVLAVVHPKPYVFAGRDTTMNFKEPMLLNGTGTGSLTWIEGDVFCKECASTQIFPTRYTCYVLQAINEFDCEAKDEVCVDVTYVNAIFVPNSFTPNADGLNDVFYVIGFGISNIKLEIYDRWGTKLFETKDIEQGWDGTFHQRSCKPDVYVYRLEYKTNDSKHFVKTGHVTLIK